jgi:chemotaxis protein CheZ
MDQVHVVRELASALDALAKRGGGLPDVSSIAEVVDGIMRTMDGDLAAGNLKLYAEVESLASYIAEARSEIAALRPEEIREQHVATANDELDAIIEATEQATNGILEAAEKIEAVAAGLTPEAAEALTDAVTKIYESCNFQDITGQRITKVVNALKHIETKVDRLMAAFGASAPVRADKPAAEPAADEDLEKALLNGPQLPQEATTQDDIDRLFAGLK